MKRQTNSAASSALPGLDSKLPDVGTTIFTQMSALAQTHNALNLSQGFPDFEAPSALIERVTMHMEAGLNQYPPMLGVAALREAIAAKVANLYDRRCDPDTEVTVTAGATEALFCAIAATVRAGDEVIVFDPAYDSYDPVIRLQGGQAIHIPLAAPDYCIDWQRVRDAITPRTRMIIVNTPHNPTGSVLAQEDLENLQELAVRHGLYVLGDEVYEHIIFDGARHESLCRYPDLFARSFVVSSFGKTYHVTGWKVGYCVAPTALTTEFRRIHQFVTFTVSTPVQYALADFMNASPEFHCELGAFYQRKRDLFCHLLEDSKFTLVPSQGTYFQLLNYSALSDFNDTDLAINWTKKHGIASIPVSVFYQNPDPDAPQVLRFCFAKDDGTLQQAAEILCGL